MVQYNQKELMKSFPRTRITDIARRLAKTEGYRFILSYRYNGDRSRSIGCCRNECELAGLLQRPDIGDFKTLYKRSRTFQKA